MTSAIRAGVQLACLGTKKKLLGAVMEAQMVDLNVKVRFTLFTFYEFA